VKKQAEFINSEKLKSLAHLKKESVELSLTRCGYKECNAGYIGGPHKKSYYTLFAMVDGESVSEINGIEYHFKKNDFVMVYPEQEIAFKYAVTDTWSFAWVGFAGMKADECAIHAGFSPEKPVQNIDCSKQVQEFIDAVIEVRENTFANILRRNGLLKIFFAELIEYHNKQFLEEQLKDVHDTEKLPHIKRTITYINDNYASKIKINELADHVGVNRSYLASSFKKATGYSPKEYLLSLRMEKAKSLLEKTDMPVNAIANSVGYTDQLAFSRMFKEYTGISPKAFREKHKIQGGNEHD